MSQNGFGTSGGRASNRSGVGQIFALIGDSLNPLADAVRRSKIEWIGVRHERKGAALAAAGQGQAHRPARRVARATTGPRQHASGRWPSTKRAATHCAGAGAVRRHATADARQPTLSRPPRPDLLFRDVSLYTETISSAGRRRSRRPPRSRGGSARAGSVVIMWRRRLPRRRRFVGRAAESSQGAARSIRCAAKELMAYDEPRWMGRPSA